MWMGGREPSMLWAHACMHHTSAKQCCGPMHVFYPLFVIFTCASFHCSIRLCRSPGCEHFHLWQNSAGALQLGYHGANRFREHSQITHAQKRVAGTSCRRTLLSTYRMVIQDRWNKCFMRKRMSICYSSGTNRSSQFNPGREDMASPGR